MSVIADINNIPGSTHQDSGKKCYQVCCLILVSLSFTIYQVFVVPQLHLYTNLWRNYVIISLTQSLTFG